MNAFVSGGYLPENVRGQKTEGYIHLAGWYATLCGLADVDPTDEEAVKAKLPPIDSLDVWSLIPGQNTTSPRTDIPVSHDTLISGDYKIITGSLTHSVWTGPQFPNTTTTLAQMRVTENVVMDVYLTSKTIHMNMTTMLSYYLIEPSIT